MTAKKRTSIIAIAFVFMSCSNKEETKLVVQKTSYVFQGTECFIVIAEDGTRMECGIGGEGASKCALFEVGKYYSGYWH